MRHLLLLGLACGTAACAGGPEPVTLRPTPAQWTQSSLAPDEAVEDRWWLAYGDRSLEAIAVEAGGADLVAIAETRLREARAGLVRVRAALAPQISAELSGSSRRAGDGAAVAFTPGQPAERLTNARNATAALSGVWDADLFGANRARSRAARAGAEAAALQVMQTRIETRFTAAQLYISLREAQARLAAAERSVASLREALMLARSRAQAGLVSDLDVAQAQAALAAAEAQPAAARLAEKEARLALEALLGLPPGGLAQRLGAAAPVPAADLPARGLTPVAVVARRPDLQAAERLLASAGFDVRAARRDFFPRLTFSGLAGVQRNDPETPFNANGGVYNVAGALAAPLLTFGRLEGALAGAKAREQRAALEYRNAAVRAVSEVERALAAGLESEARAGAQARALEAAALQQRLAASRYRAGVAPFLEVLAAERAVFDAEAALAGARAEAAQAYARLSAAMGLGGQA